MLSRKSNSNYVLIGVCFFLTIGCDSEPVGVGILRGPKNGAQFGLKDPLERDKDVLVMSKPGRWLVQGKDRNGHQWEGYLVIEHSPDAFMSNGFFEWSCKTSNGNAGGRYHFEGSFDPRTRAVCLTGYTVQDRKGSVGNACYAAILSPDGNRLTNGSWQGGIAIPGTWNAQLFSELAPE